jgi:hypothetical protein
VNARLCKNCPGRLLRSTVKGSPSSEETKSRSDAAFSGKHSGAILLRGPIPIERRRKAPKNIGGRNAGKEHAGTQGTEVHQWTQGCFAGSLLRSSVNGPPCFEEHSRKLPVSSCKLKSRGKSIKCRHSDKAPGRNLNALASRF